MAPAARRHGLEAGALFPPISLNGGRYMDGGVRSRTNADLAAGCDPVLVLAPRMPFFGTEDVGPGVTLVTPDEGSLDAIGGNVFDALRWQPVVEAGTEV